MKNKCYNNGMKLSKQLPKLVWFIGMEPTRRTMKKDATTELRSWQERGTQRYNKCRNVSEADGAKKDIQKWINTLHLRCWDCQSFLPSTKPCLRPQLQLQVSGTLMFRGCRPPSRREFWQFPSKEEMSEMVETATPENLARLETDGKWTNNVLLSGIFTGASINKTITK